MGDDADGSATGLNLHEGFDCLIERFRIKRTESFIDKKRFEYATIRSTTVADDIGQTERECERRLELFATTERTGSPRRTGMSVKHTKVESRLPTTMT